LRGFRSVALGVLALFAASIVVGLPSGCTQGSDNPATLVAGKAVYAGMGIEGAQVTALAQVDDKVVDQTLSTYHGSFILHLPPGTYTLTGTALVPRGEGELQVGGEISGVLVENERLDRITILMDGETTDD
jgi:hypothetical protein